MIQKNNLSLITDSNPIFKSESVSAIVFNDNRTQILLIKRRDVPIWVLPGGGIDKDETPANAVIREVKEETGLNVKIVRHIAIYTPINKLSKVTFLYECTPVDGELSTGNETRDIGFYALDKLPQPFFFIHQDWIIDAQRNLDFVMIKPLSKVTYLRFFMYLSRSPIQVFRFLLSRLGLPINT